MLKTSGCIAVSGGLEVASDRLLELIQKGVSVAQVAQVNKNFTEAGIMVHAYLMYGFPTQTVQATINSLKMVRQLFEIGILQSGFWHQFAMTAHSPVGLNPEKFNVIQESNEVGTFANNDLNHIYQTGIDHSMFSYGLKKSLYNFMHGIGFDIPLNQWFDEKSKGRKLPKTKILPHFIEDALNASEMTFIKPSAKVVWLQKTPEMEHLTKRKKGNEWQMVSLSFVTKKAHFSVELDEQQGNWLRVLLQKNSVFNANTWTLKKVQADYVSSELESIEDFELFWYSKNMRFLKSNGLLCL